MEVVISNLLREVLSKLSSPIQKEFALLWGMEKEKQKLESNLLAIEAVLQDAEGRQVKEKAVRDWLRKLKDVAYDADDLVDEFMVEALRRKVEIRDGMQKKVHNFFSPTNPLVFRFKMAHKMQELRERVDEIAKEKNNFHFDVGVVEIQPPISRTRETHSYVIESEVYGRDDEKADIIDSLINSGVDEVLSVISIVGMVGLGKTTLAQLVYNDESVATHFDLKIWVYVSEDFDVWRLLREILKSAMKDKSDSLSMDLLSMDTLSMDMLQTCLRRELSGKRYLLVMDDVWNEVHEKWDKLKTILKCGSQGSKIIVTTRNNKVASIMGAVPTHDLATLSENDSWSLFEKLAHPNPKLVSIGKEMVRKCDGLPLAVKTLGGLMSSKNENEWWSVKNSELWVSQGTDEGILPLLRLSYNNLTPHLKQCFAYCAVFRKGQYFIKDKLIKQWVAQGFIQPGDENKLLEEIGEDFFNDLSSRSLFQVAMKDHEDNVIICKMHDLIHDLLRFIAGTESFSVEVSTQIVPEETRHLSLCDSKWAIESKNLEALEKCKKLRSMLLYAFTDVNICSRFRFLKVLDLSKAGITYLPNSMGKLKHLRYLDLSDANDITELPETICNLHSLQTLILYGIDLEKLPKGIKRLTSLRHIECDSLLPMPNGIGELTCLQTLPVFTISQEGGGIEELKCLNKLRGKLCIEGLENIRNEKCAHEAKLMEKQHLRSLRLSWSKVKTITDTRVNLENVIENLEPHFNLKELSIMNYMGQYFPNWIKKLTNLVKISLNNCDNCEHLLPSLGQLPFLEVLGVSAMQSMKYIFVFDGAYNDRIVFPSLKELELANLPSLEEWWPHQVDKEVRQEGHEKVLLSCLRSLKIRDFPKLIQLPRLIFSPVLDCLCLSQCIALTSLPNSIGNLTSLIHLEIDDCHAIRALPESIGNLTSLTHLKICGCHAIKSLPESVGNLISLKEFEISSCPEVRALPESIGNLTSILNLKIWILPVLTALPKSIGNLKSLNDLWIKNCRAMRSLPESVGNFTSLRDLSIEDCPEMETLPVGLQSLTNLKRLKIKNCPLLKRRLLNKKNTNDGRMGKDWHKVDHVPDIFIDQRDPRSYIRGEEEFDEEEHEQKHSRMLQWISHNSELLPFSSCSDQ